MYYRQKKLEPYVVLLVNTRRCGCTWFPPPQARHDADLAAAKDAAELEAGAARAAADELNDALVASHEAAVKDLEAKHADRLGEAVDEAARRELEELGQSLGVRVVYPPFELCTDNGAMIAFAGYQRLVAGQQVGLSFKTQARWSMETLSAL